VINIFRLEIYNNLEKLKHQ